MELNLKNFFDRFGIAWVQELSANIRNQVGIDGVAYKSVVRKIKAHSIGPHMSKSKRGKPYQRGGYTRTAHTQTGKRLVNTGDFNQHAFVYGTTENSLTIRVADGNHPTTGTPYKDIVRVNDSDLNPKPYNRKLFPKNGSDVKLMRTWGSFKSDLQAEVSKQLKQMIRDNLQKVVSQIQHH